MFIENQTINIPSKTESNITDVDELKGEIALLKEEIKKPVKFIQGCTNEKALNYNPDANLDDNSCIILDSSSAYFRFGDYNPIDSTLDIYFQTGVGFFGISELSFSTTGFKILKVLAGNISDNNWQYNINDNEIKFFHKSYDDILLKSSYGEELLMRAKIIDDRSSYPILEETIDADKWGNRDYFGCGDPTACNYHFLVTLEDGSCEYDCSEEDKIYQFCIENIRAYLKYDSMINNSFNGGCLKFN
tara:strand:- start:54 stop:791 length:738 start_codon:yes stop_codon:yes gene_type:complete